MYFEYPKLLWLLLLPVLLAAHYLYLEFMDRKPHLRVSDATPWKAGGGTVTPGEIIEAVHRYASGNIACKSGGAFLGGKIADAVFRHPGRGIGGFRNGDDGTL